MLLCIQNRDFSIRNTSLYGSQHSSVALSIHNSDIMARINSLSGSQTSPVVLCMQNNVISTRITSIHGSQTSPVLLCMQNNVISIRITSLHGSQPSSVVFACKTATFGSELLVSIGPRLRRLICESKTACLVPSLHESQTSPVVLYMQNSVISLRNISIYRSQSSFVVFASKTASFRSELQVSMVPRFRLLFCECKKSCLDPE